MTSSKSTALQNSERGAIFYVYRIDFFHKNNYTDVYWFSNN